jgi:hypothetical protein
LDDQIKKERGQEKSQKLNKYSCHPGASRDPDDRQNVEQLPDFYGLDPGLRRDGARFCRLIFLFIPTPPTINIMSIFFPF